jgi:hypothetical protein
VTSIAAAATTATSAAPATVVTAPAGLEASAPLLGVAPALLGGRLDLGHDQVVLRPLHEDLLADELLDRLEVQSALASSTRRWPCRRAGPGRAADAMDVVLRVLGQIPVDDVRDRLDVQAARGDVGGHQDRQLAFLEIVEDPQAALLVDVAGERARVPAVAREPILQPPRLFSGVGEDEDAIPALAAAAAQQQAELLLAPDVVEQLLHPLGRLLLGHDRDLGGVVHELPRQLQHPERQRGREQERLAPLGRRQRRRMKRRSAMKPMSNIRSASSMTSTSTLRGVHTCCLR